jgi:hypothetical protein
MNKTMGIAALTVIVALGLTVWLYGNARYAEGVADTKAKLFAASAQGANESASNLGRVQNETAHMSDSDVDSDLLRLGIMRNPTDY